MSTDNSVARREHHYAHHFASAEAEYNASKFGTWTFLVTEICMFGGLFVGYILYHERFSDTFHVGSTFLDWRLGALNTVVLLISSFTMALSIFYAQTNQKAKVLLNLYLTLALAFVFLGIKYIEWTHKFELGLFPGRYFNPHEDWIRKLAAGHEHLAMYFGFYFSMTGLHGLHVIFGMVLISWLIVRAHRGEFGSNYYTPVECVGLFWHLVDLVWIYLFPLLYLIG
jgi:cytochrome c oxidase subunit 3